MCFVPIYENRRMKPAEIFLKWGGDRGRGRMMEGYIQQRYISNTYVNITMYPPVQVLFASNIIKNKRKRKLPKIYISMNKTVTYEKRNLVKVIALGTVKSYIKNPVYLNLKTLDSS
jgi:hypothetical protein